MREGKNLHGFSMCVILESEVDDDDDDDGRDSREKRGFLGGGMGFL